MHISDAQREYLRQQRVLVNQQGGIYRTGASLSYTKKLEVASAYSTERDAAAGRRPNITAIAQQCGVSRGYVRKIEDELNEYFQNELKNILDLIVLVAFLASVEGWHAFLFCIIRGFDSTSQSGRRRHTVIAAATTLLLRPLDVHGAQHEVAFVIQSPNGHQSPRQSSWLSPLKYSASHHHNHRQDEELAADVSAAKSSSASDTVAQKYLNSHGWDNFPSEQDDMNYHVIDDWIDAKRRRRRRLQSLDGVNNEANFYRKRPTQRQQQGKVVDDDDWRKSIRLTQTSFTTSPPSIRDTTSSNTGSNTINKNRNRVLSLPHKIKDISQLSAIQSNAPAILLPSGPGTGKSHVLSLRVAYLLQKWVKSNNRKEKKNHYFYEQQQQTESLYPNIMEGDDDDDDEVCSPDSMIILSFTNNDASRLKERALDYLFPATHDDITMTMRNQTSQALWSGTMHAFSLAILNKYYYSSSSSSSYSTAQPPLRVLPAKEMKNRVAASLRSLLDGPDNNHADVNYNTNKSHSNNSQTEGWYRQLQLRHIQTLNDVGHSRSILFQNIVRCIDLWKEANMPLASADYHFTIQTGGEDDVDDNRREKEEDKVRTDCLELALRLGIPKSSALLALDVFPEYQARHAVAGTVDPSDLAGMAYRHLIENPMSLHLLRARLKHIIVDEYQDMSVSQHALLRLIVRGIVDDEEDDVETRLPILLDAIDQRSNDNRYKSTIGKARSYTVPSLFCAGDSSQSIYGWRGAAPLLTVDGFRKDFPQGIVAPLDVCYRVPTDILDAANMLLPSVASSPRDFTDFRSQASTSFDVSPAAAAKVASNVFEGASSSSSSARSFFKTSALLGKELLLSKGMQKLDSTVLIHGLWDDREEAKYIASTIRRRSKERRKILLTALKNLDDNISSAQENELLDFTDVAVMVRSSKQINLLEEALSKAGIPFTVVGKNDDDDATNSFVRPGGKEELIPMKQVTIMTMHKAKGEEFDDVYLAGWTEGEFPHPDAMSSNRVHEERRLAYVALTRARQRVVITHSFISRKLYYGRDGAKRFVTDQVEPSRFLYELVPSKKRIDGLANKNELLNGDNLGTFWDRSAGVKDYVAGRNIPHWFRESYKQPIGYVSKRQDVRHRTNLLEKATSRITKPAEKAPPTSVIDEEQKNEIAITSAEDKCVNYSSMTVSQLKKILLNKGLKVSGKKAALIERLDSEVATSSTAALNTVVTYSSMSVSQLKHILRRNGLKVSGTKAVLIERLTTENRHVEDSSIGYLSMTVFQLKNILRSKGLKVGGKKEVLIERLVSSMRSARHSLIDK